MSLVWLVEMRKRESEDIELNRFHKHMTRNLGKEKLHFSWRTMSGFLMDTFGTMTKGSVRQPIFSSMEKEGTYHWSALIQTRRVFHFGSEPSVGSAYPLTPATHMYIHMRCPRCWEGSKSREFDALSENFLMLQVRRPKNVSPVKEGWDCAGMLGMRQMSMLMRGGLLATLAGGLVLYRPSTTLAGLVPWRGLPCSEAS